MSYNKKLIEVFTKLYDLHKSLGNMWEAKSYKKIINTLEKINYPIKSANDLKGISGIGNRTLDKVNEIINTGRLKLLDELESDKKIVAQLELQTVMGIGPKIAKKMVDKYKIYNVKDLKRLHKNGKIKLSHMQEIGLKYYDSLNTKIPRKEIEEYTKKVDESFKENKLGLNIIIAGSYRRGKKESGDIDIIIYTEKIQTKQDLEKISDKILARIIKSLKTDKLICDIINIGQYDMMYINNKGRHVDIKLAPYNLVPFFLLYFGSGENYSREIRKIAKDKGYKLSQWGLNGYNKAKNEKNIFDKLNVEYIKPENR